MFYDDYNTLFNPRGKKADAATVARRLLAAAGDTSLSVAEVQGVVARAMTAPAPTAAPRVARVSADKRDTVGVKALPVRTIKGFLTSATAERKGVRVVAQYVEGEVWIGAVFDTEHGFAAVAVRLPPSEAPWVTVSVMASKDSGALRAFTSATSLEPLQHYLDKTLTEAQSSAWDALRTAWRQSNAWARANVSRAAAKAAMFAADDKNRYGLNVVLWDSTPSDASMGVPSSVVTPLENYPGVFVATDGNRLAAIGVDAAPGATSVVFPRAMLDFCDPREAWGSDEHKAVAIGPFLSCGRIASFPAYYEVLPRGFGVATRMDESTLEALRVPARVSLGSLNPMQMASHASLYLMGENENALRVAVRFVPKGADVHDYGAFPPRIVGTLPAKRTSADKGKVTQGFAPTQLQAAFTDDAVDAILASSDRDAYLLTGGNAHDALGPVGLVSASQIHIVMPLRLEKGDVERIFQRAEQGGLSALSTVEFAGAFLDYPVGTVAVSETGASYKALVSLAWGDTAPKYRYGLSVFPVEGPSGPETWISVKNTGVTIRFPGALVDKSYYANDSTKTDALLAQIVRNPTLPPALSPGNMPDLSSGEVSEIVRDMQDEALTRQDRVLRMNENDASALMSVLGTAARGLDAAFLLSDGMAFATDGHRAFVVPDAVDGMPSTRLSEVAIPVAALAEIEKGVGEFVVGDRWIAAGRVLAKRADKRAPDVMGIVQSATRSAPKSVWRVVDVPGFLRAAQAARKTPEAKETGEMFTFLRFDGKAMFAYGDVRSPLPASIVQYEYGSVKAAFRLSFVESALRALKDMGAREVTIEMRGELDPAFFMHGSRSRPYSIIMPVRLD